MYTQFSISSLSELSTAIAYFLTKMPFLLDNSQDSDSIINWMQERKFAIREVEFQDKWKRINISCFIQMWGSTACGWGGMGGAAMTESYTVAIHNKDYGIIAVFYRGEFAYAIKDNDIAKDHLMKGTLPGLNRLEKFAVIYKSR